MPSQTETSLNTLVMICLSGNTDTGDTLLSYINTLSSNCEAHNQHCCIDYIAMRCGSRAS